MIIGKQIKKYRKELKLSQEELADEIFVTRQTISNWENNKSYPDINSLVLLSNFFHVPLDNLIKGDLKEMKKQVKSEDVRKLKQEGVIFTAMLVCTLLTVIPLFLYLKLIGIIIWVILAGITLGLGIHLENQKKKHNIQTYKEIIAFFEEEKNEQLS